MKKYISDRIEWHQSHIDKLNHLAARIPEELNLDKLTNLVLSNQNALANALIEGLAPGCSDKIMGIIARRDDSDNLFYGNDFVELNHEYDNTL